MKHELTGKVFYRLTVIEKASGPGERNIRWRCRCICGNEKEILSGHLVSGTTKSCGCLNKERNENNQYGLKHGHNKRPYNGGQSRTYVTYYKMLDRCINPNNGAYDYYGGRGIKVCERWKESFENFLEDMGERPEDRTLDRYPDKNGNYEPDNCRWATKKEQAANRRPRSR